MLVLCTTNNSLQFFTYKVIFLEIPTGTPYDTSRKFIFDVLNTVYRQLAPHDKQT